MYFSGIELNDGRGNYPFQDTCARLENGFVTAGDPAAVLGLAAPATPARPASSCRQQFESGMFHYVTRIRDRRFVAVDRERGIAFAFAFFDNAAGEARNVTLRDGRQVASGSTVPWTWQIAEAFKIEKGLIGPVGIRAAPGALRHGFRLEQLGRRDVESTTDIAVAAGFSRRRTSA